MASCDRTPPPAAAPTRPTPPGARPEPPPLPPIIEMGQREGGAWSVRASRDQGECYPGAILPTQVRLTPREGAPAVASVHAWVGYEDPLSSRSQVVDMVLSPDDPALWTADLPFPAPYPDEAELWVRVVGADAAAHVLHFNLAP